MTRCEITDLEPSMCAHCRPPAPVAASPRRGQRGTEPWPDEGPGTPPAGPTGRWFHAVRAGTCAVCHTPYAPGTPVRMYIPAGWIASCCDTPTW
ncbi:hypothetical protein ACIPSJ_01640 [Streptomyces sp. NPDC090088]|uniref:hypothetical protein n=1 Tax=Streptomyces sp. NPDC090088 TaxID=3365944 RepID=UPI00380C1ED6